MWLISFFDLKLLWFHKFLEASNVTHLSKIILLLIWICLSSNFFPCNKNWPFNFKVPLNNKNETTVDVHTIKYISGIVELWWEMKFIVPSTSFFNESQSVISIVCDARSCDARSCEVRSQFEIIYFASYCFTLYLI